MLPKHVLNESFGIPTDSYAICSNPRSGSTYLIFLLQSTGVLGAPYEWLRGDGGTAHWDYPSYPADNEGQMKYLLRDGCTPNGICAVKMFPEHFDTRIESRWAERMPNLHYIHLVRSDLLGQAISLSIARQTDSYAYWSPEKSEPIYDAGHIQRCMDFVVSGDARWRVFFATNGIEPLVLTYEELATSPQETVDRIARSFGIDSAPINWAGFNTRVQRGERNADWRARFIRERGDLAVLPPLRNGSYEDALWRPQR